MSAKKPTQPSKSPTRDAANGYKWRALFPQHSWIKVESVGVSDADLDVFIPRFRATWRRLPLAARRAVLRHWREHYRRTCGQDGKLRCTLGGRRVVVPAVYHPVELIARRDWRHNPRASGVETFGGYQARYRHDVAVKGSAIFAAEIIAHELAHVYQWAIGFLPANLAEAETDVQARLRAWGFSAKKGPKDANGWPTFPYAANLLAVDREMQERDRAQNPE